MPPKKKAEVKPKRTPPASFLPGEQKPYLPAQAEGNIRERKPAEDALQKSELRYRELIIQADGLMYSQKQARKGRH